MSMYFGFFFVTYVSKGCQVNMRRKFFSFFTSFTVQNQVPEEDTAVRSLTVMWDGSLVVAANNRGTCYVWRLMRGTQV